MTKEYPTQPPKKWQGYDDFEPVSPESQLFRARVVEDHLQRKEKDLKLAPGTLQRRPDDPVHNPTFLGRCPPALDVDSVVLTPAITELDAVLHPVKIEDYPPNPDLALEPPGGVDVTLAIAENNWSDASKCLAVLTRHFWDNAVNANTPEMIDTLEAVARIQILMAKAQLLHQQIKTGRRPHRATGRPPGRPRKTINLEFKASKLDTNDSGLLVNITEAKPTTHGL